MLDLGIISPAMIKLFLECKGKFFYRYIEQIPAPKLDKTFVIGKNIHALASYVLKGVNIDKLELALTEKECDYWDYLKKSIYFDFDVIGVEKNISIKLGGYWIGGRIDAIVKKDNHIYVLDYKTGGVSNDMAYDPQTMVYLLLCDSFFKDYDVLSFVYIDLKNKKEVEIKLTPQLKKEYEAKLLEICSQMSKFDKMKFERLENCACEYNKVCR